jgi:hypothetical protein
MEIASLSLVGESGFGGRDRRRADGGYQARPALSCKSLKINR